MRYGDTKWGDIVEDGRLNHLLSYTTFHIGVYLSLVGALIGAGIFGSLDHGLLRFAVACFLIAGICGGVVGSSIPDYKEFAAFAEADLGFWGIPIAKYNWWTRAEHIAFWVGILPLTLTFLWMGPKAFK
jgi:hypothetical protein